MATNEDLKLVAIYDGWKFVGRSGSIDNKREVYERKHSRQFLDYFQYADSFDKLIPVARKLVAELKEATKEKDESKRLGDKEYAKVCDSVNAIQKASHYPYDLSTLFASVVAGIKLINEVKQRNETHK